VAAAAAAAAVTAWTVLLLPRQCSSWR